MNPLRRFVPSSPDRRLRLAVSTLLVSALAAFAAQAQPTLSIDYQGPSAFGGFMDPGGVYLATPGPGPLPLPALLGGPAVLGFGPGGLGFAEMDALSWGRDTQLRTDSTGTTWRTTYRVAFSTDEFAVGDPALGAPPDLFSEGIIGNREASADVQIMGLIPGTVLAPVAPGPLFGHSSWLDGDGLAPFGGFGVGVMEPNFPTFNAVPDIGDTIDALDFQGPSNRIYFSLDARWQDPFEGVLSNAGTAAANGVLPGDVLVSSGGGVFGIYASAAQLGLGSMDDLDALILWENGDGVFTPSQQPFDWMLMPRDMLLFSVRRGSPIIGTADSLLGLPIEEGDILTTPRPPSTVPGIFIAAEVLGLGTVRSLTNFTPAGDDLNALSVR